jgi:hypothetical protein
MLESIREELNSFAKHVIKQSRANLTRGKKKSSGELYKSLDYELKENQGSISLSFIMAEYGMFQDLGVSGIKKKYNTPFSYKDKMPPPSKMDKWIVRKGLKGVRDKKGRFISRKSLQFMIARSIYMNGIKPSLFFTKPFNKAFENLGNDIIDNLDLDFKNNK